MHFSRMRCQLTVSGVGGGGEICHLWSHLLLGAEDSATCGHTYDWGTSAFPWHGGKAGPPINRPTDACENITFPQRLGAVKMAA